MNSKMSKMNDRFCYFSVLACLLGNLPQDTHPGVSKQHICSGEFSNNSLTNINTINVMNGSIQLCIIMFSSEF